MRDSFSACRMLLFFFFSSRRRHTRFKCDWSSDVCSSDLREYAILPNERAPRTGVVAHLTDHNAQAIDRVRLNVRESRQRAEIRHRTITRPQEPVYRASVIAGLAHHLAGSINRRSHRVAESGKRAKIGQARSAGPEKGPSVGGIPGCADNLA